MTLWYYLWKNKQTKLSNENSLCNVRSYIVNALLYHLIWNTMCEYVLFITSCFNWYFWLIAQVVLLTLMIKMNFVVIYQIKLEYFPSVHSYHHISTKYLNTYYIQCDVLGASTGVSQEY